MASQKLNIQVDQGTDYSETIIAKNPDGTVLDVTGFSAAGQIRKSYTSSTATNFTVTFGTRTAGEVIIGLARAQTSSLEAGRYVYDVEITSSTNSRTRLAEGQVTVTQEVTREGPIDFVTEVVITDPQDGAFLIYESANTNWVDSTQIRATSNTVIDVTGTLEADGFSGTGALTVTDFIDDDSFGTANNTNIATSESVKAYVDATSAGIDALAELVDTNITSASSGQFIIHDGTDSFDNKTISGDIAITNQGVASITAGSIVNADVNASAGIEIGKTALAGGTGITLSGNTLSLTANSALTNLGGDGANTTHILRKDGTFIPTPVYTAGVGLDLSGDDEFSLSSDAAIINLGYDANDQAKFLRHDGIWSATEEYYGATGITVTPNSNTQFQSGKDAISLSAGAALVNLGGSVGGSATLFLNERGQFSSPTDNDTQYFAGTGINIDLNVNAVGNNIISLQSDAALVSLGGESGNTALNHLFLSANGSFATPIVTEAGAGLTLTANTSSDTNSVFSVNANLSHVVGTGALNSGSITSGFGDIDIGLNTISAGQISSNAAVFELTSISSGSGAESPSIELFRRSPDGDANDELGAIKFFGSNDNVISPSIFGEKIEYAQIYTEITDPSDGAETGQLRFAAARDGVLRDVFTVKDNASSFIESLTVTGGVTGATVNTNKTPTFILHHEDYPSGDDGDILGQIKFTAKNDNGLSSTIENFAGMYAKIVDETDGTEDGELILTAMTGGAANTSVLTLNGSGTTVHSNLTVSGDLTVNGTETVVNSTTLSVDDKNIVLGSVDTPTDTTADGGGITLKGATDKTINWINSTDSWTASENFELASGKQFRINGNNLLSQTALGSTVLGSSLTSVGTIGTGTWQGTAIANTYVGSLDASKIATGTIAAGRLPDSALLALGTTSTTALAGDTAILALGTTSTTALAGDTALLALGTSSTTALAGDTAIPDVSSFITASSSETLTNKSIAATQLTGTIADARIAAASVTQHQGSITGTGALNAGSITSGFGNIDIGANTVTAGATTINGELTVNSDTLKLTSTTASSTVEHPSLELYRNGGTGSADLGAIKFFGNNNADPLEKFQYAGIYASVQTAADGNEQGSLAFSLGHGGGQEDPAMSLFSYGLQMGYGNPILMSYSNGYQQFFSPNAAQKSFKLNATPNATVANGTYDIYLPDVTGGTLVAANSAAAFTAGATTVNGALAVNNTAQSITDTTTNSISVYGPTIELYRDGGEGDGSSTTVGGSDKLGTIDFYGNNDAGTPEKIKYAKIFSTIYEETDGAESGRLSFSVINAGTHTESHTGSSILDLEPDVAQFNQTVRIKSIVNDNAANATPTPILELFQSDGPSADDGDHLGEIQFTALNDNGYSPVKHKYAGIHAEIIDETNNTEDGSLHFTCIKAGTEDNTVLTLNGSGSTLFSDLIAPLTIKSNTTDADLIITNSLDSADASPIIKLHREAGPNGHADGDDVGKLEFHGTNDRGLSSGGPEDVLFGSMFTEVVDSSDGTEDGQIKFTAIKAGSATDVLTLNGSGSTLTGSLEITGGVTASQTLVNAVTDTSIDATEFASYSGKKVVYTGGAGTVILADAVSGDLGKGWTLVNAGTGAITIDRATNSQTIKLLNGSAVSAGSANLTLATGGVIEITCTAADNYIAFGSGIS